ncbi:hypothetical protein MIND_00653100 [Mycena indigotica]|uniref:Methyltransferase domain-containing protein n=1 Tax=Mycena indigotica TaxID=2126181 RepID=A0A8H6W9J9_9AGAR|nr:uncharacterized protein MIND_00653100 [Mycena indigotica]KAF7304209.1 hypothetical protein MIND_00653100 [Mycena indigotica]
MRMRDDILMWIRCDPRPTMASHIPPLDLDLWTTLAADDQALAFFQAQTGLTDREEIEKHVLGVQARAYASFPYTCIRVFSFLRLKIALLPAYSRAIKLLLEQPTALFLDVGCFFGTDARKVVADGVPAHNVIACDLRQEFWELGHALFKSTRASFPATFLAGDILNSKFLASATSAPTPLTLASLRSLTELQGHVSVLHISFVFHLFSALDQLAVISALANLLSPLPGTIIFGAMIATRTAGLETFFRDEAERASGDGLELYIHSPDSWSEILEGLFPQGSVRIETHFRGQGELRAAEDFVPVGLRGEEGIMDWSCERL